MAGDPIAAVNQGLIDLRDEVAKHPLIGKKVRFGIITFAESAQTRLEFSELSEELVLPTLSPRGRGRATRARSRHCVRRSPPMWPTQGQRLSGAPPVGVRLSDGLPTEKAEKWQARLAELKDPSFRGSPTSSRSASARPTRW